MASELPPFGINFRTKQYEVKHSSDKSFTFLPVIRGQLSAESRPNWSGLSYPLKAEDYPQKEINFGLMCPFDIDL